MDNMKIMHELEQSLASLDPADLKATLAYLLKVYVLEKGPAYRGAVQEVRSADLSPAGTLTGAGGGNISGSASGGTGPATGLTGGGVSGELRDPLRREYSSFTELISALKRSCRLEELNLFTVEGGNVYITLENKRFQLSAAAPSRQEPPVKPGGTTISGFRHLEMD